MSRLSKLFCLALAVVGVAFATLVLSENRERTPGTSYQIGRTATRAQLANQGLTVFPDGKGLPAGSGTARQGRLVYTTWCAACHGPRGEGTADYPRLAGGRGTLGAGDPVLTVGSYWPYATTLWDYNRRAMPYVQPGALKTDEVYAVTAYLLYLNGIVRENEVLDEESLPRIRMPNRDGFIPDPRPDLRSGGSNRSSTVR